MRELAVIHALNKWKTHGILNNVRQALDVGGARRVWLETEEARQTLRGRIRHLLLRLLRAPNLRPPKGLITTDNPFVKEIPGLTMLEMGYNSDTLSTSTDITGDFLDEKLVARLKDSYDLVISFDTLEHVSNPWKFCRHMVEVARPGGHIYVATVFSWGFHPAPNDYYRYSPEGLKECFRDTPAEMIEAGWDEEGVSVFAFLKKQDRRS